MYQSLSNVYSCIHFAYVLAENRESAHLESYCGINVKIIVLFGLLSCILLFFNGNKKFDLMVILMDTRNSRDCSGRDFLGARIGAHFMMNVW